MAKMENKKVKKVLYWMPRIICILAILFISIFAMDSFDPALTFWKQIRNFLMHLIPSFVLTALLVVAWKWEFPGGILFLIISFGLSPFIYFLNYNRTQSVGIGLESMLIVIFPFVLVGILFIVSHFARKPKPG